MVQIRVYKSESGHKLGVEEFTFRRFSEGVTD